jgi:hypothetical protein
LIGFTISYKKNFAESSIRSRLLTYENRLSYSSHCRLDVSEHADTSIGDQIAAQDLAGGAFPPMWIIFGKTRNSPLVYHGSIARSHLYVSAASPGPRRCGLK